jgi:hypothetical protein
LTDTIPSHDIAVEIYREYVYEGGKTYRIDEPSTLYIVGGGHRVVDAAGVTHRPERGFVAIRWVQHDGKPFIF